MYVGSTDEAEVIDNSIDEAVAGYCSEVKVLFSTDQTTLTIEDNGRGIPIAIHPETKKSTLETIFTVLHSGGKFDNKVYKTSGGLHGVGEGILVSSEITATPEAKNGITISFTPDKKIFKEFTHFRIELIQNRLQELAYLNSNLTLFFYTSPQTEPLVYHFETEEYFYLNFAWQYNQDVKKGQIKSFCNNISTGGGGTHIEGFEAGLEKSPHLKIVILKEDILAGLVVLLAVRMSDPEFTGQTKDRLANKKVRELVRNATNELVNNFLKNHPLDAETISRQVISNAQTRLKLAEQEELLRGISQTRVEAPEGLSPCLSKDTELNELGIVEGKSAAGTGIAARDPKYQAVFTIQGKILNVEKGKRGKILNNKEIRGLINSLGFNVGEATQNYYNRFCSGLDSADSKEE
ncbi:20125_t:CDS:2 [Cetraspora pellucida]|uniref:DNA topoisomerase 2 n=1 Tax=Cetraspora pellucida TaxID=1433469 RepID=A0A9N8W5F4_9GLOM|nr:20125_t:CDS:2 [Cetraspora pellucida]